MQTATDNRAAVDDIKRRLHDREIDYDAALIEIAPIVESINEKGREIAKRHNRRPKLLTAREILR